ncbi:hypothetical protein D9M71_459360 [compost metagenome]
MRRLVGVTGSLGGMGGIARHVLGGSSHLVHGGGHQVDLGHLLVYALVGADRDVGSVLRGIADFLHRGHHLADHRLQLGQEGVEALGDRAQFIGAVTAQAAGQVTFALGNVVEHGHHLP